MKVPGSRGWCLSLLLCLICLFILEAKGRRKKDCKYSRRREQCNSITRLQRITFTLVEGDEKICRMNKAKTQSCDPQAVSEISECRYFRKGQRGRCDVNTRTRNVVVYLRLGDFSCPATKVLSKPCRPRRKKSLRRERKKKDCHYFRQGEKGSCDLKTGLRSIVVKLKKGGDSCALTETIFRPCKRKTERKKTRKRYRHGCKYSRKHAVWSECDLSTHTKTKVMRLLRPNPLCPPSKVRSKKCRPGRRKRIKGKDCVYSNQDWSSCDKRTNTRQRERVLISGDRKSCLPKKIVTKQCQNCQFTKGNWTECDQSTKLMTQTWTPLAGSSPHCQTTVHSKPCSLRAELTAAESHKCKYEFSDWSSCDPRTDTRTQVMSLKNGDPNLCQRSVKLSKKCRRACKFQRGNWSECNNQTGLMTRTDTLLKGRPEECDGTREITKKCHRKSCRYDVSAWSECDPATNQRSRVKKLIKGKQEECKREEIIRKSCLKQNGQVRCFFGTYGDFGPCTNGVMTKHRPVLQGGVECERKAVITKAC